MQTFGYLSTNWPPNRHSNCNWTEHFPWYSCCNKPVCRRWRNQQPTTRNCRYVATTSCNIWSATLTWINNQLQSNAISQVQAGPAEGLNCKLFHSYMGTCLQTSSVLNMHAMKTMNGRGGGGLWKVRNFCPLINHMGGENSEHLSRFIVSFQPHMPWKKVSSRTKWCRHGLQRNHCC